MEENKRFSWSDLFIKIILVIVFILFAVWLLSLSNKKITNSLDVLTDEIFAENIEKMKEVGKEYFTTERLPEKVGDVKALTLKEMYEKKLILEIKDKNGNACDAEDSYVTIEKFDTEYQMKVNLECDEQEDYIIVIMGCYDYCSTTICEKQEVETPSKQIEYEYKKTTGGYWSEYGSWSEWSKISITKTDYRQVETKVVKEEYTYDKTETETLFEEVIATCPDGYKKDGDICYKEKYVTTMVDPVCDSLSGYTLIGRDGFTCKYSKNTTETAKPVCPSLSGYTLVSQNGFVCNYSKSTTETTDPNKCAATYNGYSLVSQNGFTCNYSKEVTTSYQERVKVSKTCYSSKTTIPCTGCAPVTQRIPYDCSYYDTVTRYKTETQTTTTTVGCPSGYSQSGSTCVKTVESNETRDAVCPSGYNKSGNTCVKTVESNETKVAVCPSGYKQDGDKCSKTALNVSYKKLNLSCPCGYEFTSDNSKCYKDVTKVVKATGVKEVTYYRYRIREYIGGSVDYKWSTSKNDKSLLDAGYKLTGRTR